MIPSPPVRFDGTLAELFVSHTASVLPPVEDVERLHTLLAEHCYAPDAVFVVRQVTGIERGVIYVNASGERLLASDNAPAWWMHYVAFNRLRPTSLNGIPTHMFEAVKRISANVNAAGWHVAHIYNVKDRNTDWRNWSREDLVRRFIRNVHPCNCFYLPKPRWQRYGGDPGVIGFFAGEYARRYGRVWEEFRHLAGGDQLQEVDGAAVRYTYDHHAEWKQPLTVPEADGSPVAASYRFSRLCFRAAVIEPLGDDDVFEVVTPEGTFRMTKAEFYREFPGVVQSASYREHGMYHYPKLPRIALKYRH